MTLGAGSFPEPPEKKKSKEEEEIEHLEAVSNQLKEMSEEFLKMSGLTENHYINELRQIYENNNLDTEALDDAENTFDIILDVKLKVSILHDRKYEWRM
jgi:hypothetical protein